ncbi:MAG: hypothetical protein E6J75_04805 [Deltaproteobacteria bacterium]|nr:MAG: hypothetical protein E6J75_04805 [Deltaproteobacteria bacterium]
MPDDLTRLLCDPGRLAPWLDAQESEVGLEAGRPLSVERITTGHSNETFLVRRGGSAWILRRPPRVPLAPTAHDMVREARLLRALAGTAVPVPHLVAACADPNVIGAPFHLTERLDGWVIRERVPEAFRGAPRGRLARARPRGLRPPGRLPRPPGRALDEAARDLPTAPAARHGRARRLAREPPPAGRAADDHPRRLPPRQRDARRVAATTRDRHPRLGDGDDRRPARRPRAGDGALARPGRGAPAAGRGARRRRTGLRVAPRPRPTLRRADRPLRRPPAPLPSARSLPAGLHPRRLVGAARSRGGGRPGVRGARRRRPRHGASGPAALRRVERPGRRSLLGRTLPRVRMLACAHAWMLSREEACACVKDYASPSHLLGETRSRIVRPGKHPTRSLAHSPTRVRHGTVCGSLGILLGRWHATPALSKHGAHRPSRLVGERIRRTEKMMSDNRRARTAWVLAVMFLSAVPMSVAATSPGPGDNGQWASTPASVRAVRGAKSNRGGNGHGRWSSNPRKPPKPTTTSTTPTSHLDLHVPGRLRPADPAHRHVVHVLRQWIAARRHAPRRPAGHVPAFADQPLSVEPGRWERHLRRGRNRARAVRPHTQLGRDAHAQQCGHTVRESRYPRRIRPDRQRDRRHPARCRAVHHPRCLAQLRPRRLRGERPRAAGPDRRFALRRLLRGGQRASVACDRGVGIRRPGPARDRPELAHPSPADAGTARWAPHRPRPRGVLQVERSGDEPGARQRRVHGGAGQPGRWGHDGCAEQPGGVLEQRHGVAGRRALPGPAPSMLHGHQGPLRVGRRGGDVAGAARRHALRHNRAR